jgi:hypothetical protein
MLFLVEQSKPIVVQVVKQPPITPEIGMADVVLGAVGLTGAIMIAAAVVGLVVGALFILYKRSQDASAPPTDPGHARLRIQ